ncbi:MAG: FAD-dependent oxidoreductase [Campylobacterales bacterium]
MSAPLFSTWRGVLIDNRQKEKESWQASELKLPLQFSENRPARAFIGWDGVAIFDEKIDVVRLASEYAAQYQCYSEACGRCAPGRWGGRILYDLLDKIARGEGERSDLKHIEETCRAMKATSKCEIGRTVPVPILQLIEHFGEQFNTCIEKKQKSSEHGLADSNYVAKVTAPCMDACPDRVDIPAYIEGVRDRLLDESVMATRKAMPLAHTCGRVCPHPCENACRRTNLDSPIAIMELKRMGADFEADHDQHWLHPLPKAPSIGKKVAIVGAGPAGLTAGYYLSMGGVECDIFEALPVPGGEVMVGVPEYRMPSAKYFEDIRFVESSGAKIHLNTPVTADMLREFEKSYDAIVLASGTRLSKAIRCDNENPKHEGYWSAIEFLDQINLWEKFKIGSEVDLSGKTVVCVGGGFTSMDVVRCSVRAKAKRIVMLYRRDEKTIINNTSLEEYHEAVEEGVEFIFHSAIERIVDENGKIVKVICNRFEMQADPNGGRPQLVKVEGADFELECDYVIPAVSQDADLKYLPQEWALEMTSWNTLKTDGKTYMTNKHGVWAAGDCEYGPMTIVNAVGQARRAANVMLRYFKTGVVARSEEEIMEDLLRTFRVYDKKEKVSGWMAGLERPHTKKLDVDYRKQNNEEVNFGLTPSQAFAEAERCMRCYYIAMVAL